MGLFGAQTAYAETLNEFIGNADNLIINPIIKLLFALAVVYFLYGVFEFILNQQSEEKKTTGKSHMLWGVIGITIMIGVWSILTVLLNTFGLSNQVKVSDPQNGKVDITLPDYNPTYPPTN